MVEVIFGRNVEGRFEINKENQDITVRRLEELLKVDTPVMIEETSSHDLRTNTTAYILFSDGTFDKRTFVPRKSINHY